MNEGFEYILSDGLHSDIQPITRLAAYLGLRYKVQALIQIGWFDGDRPIGFFDLMRNIRVITHENDLRGLIAMTMRVFLPLSDNELTRSDQIFAITQAPFEEVGALWFIELILLDVQNEQRAHLTTQSGIDFGHPLISSFNRLGLECIEGSDLGDVEFRPIKTPITVDEVMKTFIAKKPGAKSSSITVWKMD